VKRKPRETSVAIQKADTEAVELVASFEALFDEAIKDEFNLDQKRMRMGATLDAIRTTEAWSKVGYETFDKFVTAMGDKYKKGRTSLYIYAGIVRDLAPYASTEQLQQIGVTKGKALAAAVKASGKAPSAELLSLAASSDVTEQDLREMIFNETQILTPPKENMTYLDLGGFYVTVDEKNELQELWEVAQRVGELEGDTKSVRKQCLLYIAADFLGTHREVGNAK